ncbi:endonuclease/exonuclease/phosphatase domain containing protein [Plasmodium cynomolgi strain B]|uniref:Endonuclease/exonuclease/phosphatase domain containing protein n=1 Tax=Plasmodium cynomolgi (strain B) TaxID=1120755 RepID=K6UK00_PLACD|nr:endonuclease/exonuclease/phosphatase domain containing protein [Plasmodium cynomolgi strain B]GAB66393.1 endonuclease/exonuclease/phosphatase domain containing protein [Plasmodium cynomolgi strain B]
MSDGAPNKISIQINDGIESVPPNKRDRITKTNSIGKTVEHEDPKEETPQYGRCYSDVSGYLPPESFSRLGSIRGTNENLYWSGKSDNDVAGRTAYPNGNDAENLPCQQGSENLKMHSLGLGLRNSNKKSFPKKEMKKVMGYNYFTYRQQLMKADDSKILKNIPLSIFVGTWNCEYFDFSKEYHNEKKMCTSNYLSESCNEDMYSLKVSDRYSARSVTPFLRVNALGNYNNIGGSSTVDTFATADDRNANNSYEGIFDGELKTFQEGAKENQSSPPTLRVIPCDHIETVKVLPSSLNELDSVHLRQGYDSTSDMGNKEEGENFYKGGKTTRECNNKLRRSLCDVGINHERIKFKSELTQRTTNRITWIKRLSRHDIPKEGSPSNECNTYCISPNRKKVASKTPTLGIPKRVQSGDPERAQMDKSRRSQIDKPRRGKIEKLRRGDNKETEKSNYNLSQLGGNNSNRRSSKSREKQIFSTWIQPHHDIYIICLQESISDNIIECLSLHLKEINQETYKFLPLADCKLSGYGDGAFLQMKSTTMAAWVRTSKLYPNGPVKLCASKSIAFSKINNSKGCVSILFNIFNQFILFIGCHMPAKDQEIRQKSREFILTKLSEYFSNKITSNFKDVFHHVIWMGDFNFRVQGIRLDKAVHCLQTNNLKELLKYDEGNSAYSYDLCISFQELPICFLPTYKKNGNRPVINRDDANWVQKEYKLVHNIKWYKGGRQESRIPSWTDRIFKWSCDKTRSCLIFVPNSYLSPLPEEQSILMASDHSPVSCCFQMYMMKNEREIPLTKVTLTKSTEGSLAEYS